ncbi:carbohydrate ABC transporter permease [Paenibacillus mendelii]|uniref:Carbohydrate ABC transporter permease n=1 Tax=Paenibacillus mendelii TaxID=206163 RepID=A0ABV6J7Y6_9BACL|nr:sugar ABC transporter permease [Paenibacillus mendelii]MCQ6561352.1 sugar ABC transporter permease [Paenibacillus mendelii]
MIPFLDLTKECKFMDRMLRNKWMIALFVLPALLLYTFFLPLPIVNSIYYSFFDWNVVGAKVFIAFDNYRELFMQDDIFILALKNTLIFTLESVLLQLPIALILAILLSSKLRGVMFFRNVYFTPVIISGTAVGLLWQFIYHSDIGLLNTAARAIGFAGFDKAWLSDSEFAIHAVVISVAWQFFGYHMVIFLAGMSTIHSEVLESARIDGASEWKVIWYIILPLMKPFIAISLILITTSSVKAFDNVIALTGGGPARSSTVLALHMYSTAFQQMRYGFGSAVSVFLLGLNMFFTLLISLMFRQGRESRGAEK